MVMVMVAVVMVVVVVVVVLSQLHARVSFNALGIVRL
jgi:hypothetical protein